MEYHLIKARNNCFTQFLTSSMVKKKVQQEILMVIRAIHSTKPEGGAQCGAAYTLRARGPEFTIKNQKKEEEEEEEEK